METVTVYDAPRIFGFVSLVLVHLAWAGSYDPLVVDPNFHPKMRDLTVHDAARERDIPVRIYFPPNDKPASVVLFSHGLGGSRKGSKFLGERWAECGYLAVFVQHRGSDELVWKNARPAERMAALPKAASLENFFLRVGDIRAVLDQLQAWNQSGPLANRMDLTRIGMPGHSFGAVTTQAVSGERFLMSGTELTDPRIRAAVIMSPSTPKSETAERAFGDVKIPWLLMTGTKDVSPLGETDAKARLTAYPALHGVPKYQVVLNNADHSVFADRELPGDRGPRNLNHHRVIRALSTAFWDAYLQDNKDALAWLNGTGPRSLMEAADDWEASPEK